MVEILDRLIALHQMVPLVLMLNFLSFLETNPKKSELVKNFVTSKKSFILPQVNKYSRYSAYLLMSRSFQPNIITLGQKL